MRILHHIAMAVGLVTLHTHAALAAGAVVGHGTSTVVISDARMAVALAPGRMTRWMQVTVTGSQAGFLWLVPVAPGARVDLASDAWLDALDDATTPTIVAPQGAAACDGGGACEQLSRSPMPASTGPAGSGVAVDAPTLNALVAAGGATLSEAQATAFGAVFDSGLDVVVLDYDTTASTARTHSVQVVEGATRSLDIPVTGGSALYTDATAFVIAEARANVGPTSLTLDPAAITWGADCHSSYASAREHALDAAAGEAWLVDSSMAGRLFEPLTQAGAPELPALLGQYFRLASAAGDTTVDPGTCEAAAATLSGSSNSVAALCPPGALAVAPGTSPCTTPAGTPTSTSFTCGAGVTDAAFALANLAPSSVWLTRASGVLLPGQSYDPAISVTAGAPVSPVVTASVPATSSSAATAEPPAAGSTTSESSAPGSASTANAPGSDSTSDPGSDTASTAVDVVAKGTEEAASDGCDGSSSNSSDSESSGCSSSSDDSSSSGCSSSSDDSDDGCSVQRSGHPMKGRTTRLLLFGCLVLSIVRRATRPGVSGPSCRPNCRR
jgi:hypothetical protein